MASGGGFRGTGAGQDVRFSNKEKKLMKSMKFPKELDVKVDMKKVNMDVMKPWIAKRVTELLGGLEDEVLIGLIYNQLEQQDVEPKRIQIDLTGFLEKNTSLFMKELWSLLASAQGTKGGVPQQFLDEEAERIRKRNEEQQKITVELQHQREAALAEARSRSEAIQSEHVERKGKESRWDSQTGRGSRWDHGRGRGTARPGSPPGLPGPPGPPSKRRSRSRSRSSSPQKNGRSLTLAPRRGSPPPDRRDQRARRYPSPPRHRHQWRSSRSPPVRRHIPTGRSPALRGVERRSRSPAGRSSPRRGLERRSRSPLPRHRRSRSPQPPAHRGEKRVASCSPTPKDGHRGGKASKAVEPKAAEEHEPRRPVTSPEVDDRETPVGIPEDKLSKEERKRLKKEKKERKRLKKEKKRAKQEKEAVRGRSEEGDRGDEDSGGSEGEQQRNLEEDLRKKALDAMRSK